MNRGRCATFDRTCTMSKGTELLALVGDESRRPAVDVIGLERISVVVRAF